MQDSNNCGNGFRIANQTECMGNDTIKVNDKGCGQRGLRLWNCYTECDQRTILFHTYFYLPLIYRTVHCLIFFTPNLKQKHGGPLPGKGRKFVQMKQMKQH